MLDLVHYGVGNMEPIFCFVDELITLWIRVKYVDKSLMLAF